MPDTDDDRLQVFVSWSGPRSGIVADGLRNWLGNIVDEPSIWLSALDIPDGSRWSRELGEALERSDFGVIVLTPENLASPWILFEAGALSKHLRESRVVPYLVGVDKGVLAGPLAQFQSVTADCDGTRRLVEAIVEATRRKPAPEAIARRFRAFWPELEAILIKAREARLHEPVARDSKDALAITSLQAQLANLTELIRQHVNPEAVTAAPSLAGSMIDVRALEGAWVSDHSHMYVRIINGRVLAPYCYEGDDELTGAYFDWQPFSDHFFARFEWFGHPIRGFAFYKLASDDRLEGMWWLAADIPVESFVEVPKTGGARTEWRRVVARTPRWAEKYFRQQDAP
jgi:hypothetical protein